METSWLLSPGAVGSRPAGGKARGLRILDGSGLSTPPWRVIPSDSVAGAPWRDAQDTLDACFAELSQPPFDGVAARSSAAKEDGARASRAGVFETVFVDTAAGLPEAIEKVVASAEGQDTGMAVILQARVAAEVSGVAFSAQPGAADYDTAYVEAVSGAGAGLVGGSKAPLRLWIGRADGAVLDTEPGADGPEELSAAVLSELAGALRKLEETMDAVVDVEWAYASGKLWFLQVRPLTALSLHPDYSPETCATSWFFDQRFIEPLSPFTQSTLLPLILRLSIAEPLAMQAPHAPEPAAFIYGGLPYVPHDTWRYLLGDVSRALLSADLRQLFPARCHCAREKGRPRKAWRAVTGLVRMIRQCRDDAMMNIARWHRFRDGLGPLLPLKEAAPPADETAWRAQWEALDALTVQFLRIHRWSIMWANYAYGLFRLIRQIVPERLSERMDQVVAANTRLVTGEANRALARYLEDPKREPDFISRYGHRSPSLDYATPTWADLDRAGELAAAYPRASAASTETQPRVGLLSRLLWPLCRLLEMREEQRFHWERILAAQRAMVTRTIEKRLTPKPALKSGLLRDEEPEPFPLAPEDAWFLNHEELLGVLYRRQKPPALAERKHRHRVDRVARRPFFIGPGAGDEKEGSGSLRGLGASAGVARGTALVLASAAHAPDAIPPGTVAVLRALDPAWTPLLPRFAGLVVERGGLLSHVAVQAREYGVPLVIGVDNATGLLRNGEVIEIDGAHGTVRRVSSSSSART